MICAVVWYIAVSLAVALALPSASLSDAAMATADAANELWGGSWAGTLLVLGGIGGILTSWNAFIVGASRVVFALADSGHLPAAFARLHPRYKTPYVGILAIGLLSVLAPLFGRTILAWLINSGGLLSAFLPWSDSALVWPDEWLTILVWTGLGAIIRVAKGR